MEDACSFIKYSASFSWSDLFGCTNYEQDTFYLSIQSDENFINMSGTLYVDIVSPYAINQDIGGYRVYGALTHPFVFSINRNVFGLASIGIDLYKMSVLSIGYTQNENKQLSITFLTEASDQLYLHSAQILSYPMGNYIVNTTQSLSPMMSNCLSDKQYICRQNGYYK